MQGFVPGIDVGTFQSYLASPSGTNILIGMSAASRSSGSDVIQAVSIVNGFVTPAVTTTYLVQQMCNLGIVATTALGAATGYTFEVYTTVEVFKLA